MRYVSHRGKPHIDAGPPGLAPQCDVRSAPGANPTCAWLPGGNPNADAGDARPRATPMRRAARGNPNATRCLGATNQRPDAMPGANPNATCDALPQGIPMRPLPRGNPQCDRAASGKTPMRRPPASGQPQCDELLGEPNARALPSEQPQCDVRRAASGQPQCDVLPWGNPNAKSATPRASRHTPHNATRGLGQPPMRRDASGQPQCDALPWGNPNATCDALPWGNPNALGQPQCDVRAAASGQPQCDATPR
eukprot:gene6916-30897_t